MLENGWRAYVPERRIDECNVRTSQTYHFKYGQIVGWEYKIGACEVITVAGVPVVIEIQIVGPNYSVIWMPMRLRFDSCWYAPIVITELRYENAKWSICAGQTIGELLIEHDGLSDDDLDAIIRLHAMDVISILEPYKTQAIALQQEQLAALAIR
jgi:hypothetical protein